MYIYIYIYIFLLFRTKLPQVRGTLIQSSSTFRIKNSYAQIGIEYLRSSINKIKIIYREWGTALSLLSIIVTPSVVYVPTGAPSLLSESSSRAIKKRHRRFSNFHWIFIHPCSFSSLLLLLLLRRQTSVYSCYSGRSYAQTDVRMRWKTGEEWRRHHPRQQQEQPSTSDQGMFVKPPRQQHRQYQQPVAADAGASS